MLQNTFSKDIAEFLFLLEKYKVKYLIVGGRAVIYYGFARLTGDVDIFYEKSKENIKKLYSALKEFWGGEVLGLKEEKQLGVKGQIIQYGVPPNRIDLMGSISGVDFKSCWKNKKEEKIAFKRKKIKIYYIGLEELIKNKEKMLRNKDKEDLKYLYNKKD